MLLSLSSFSKFPGNVCSDDQVDKITICHNGNHQNQGGAELNFQNLCIPFSSIWGHFQSDLLDTVGECGTELTEGKVFACNAGIKHEEPSDVICIQYDNEIEADNCDGSSNCVCSSYDGLASLDYMSHKGFQFLDFSQLSNPNNYVLSHKVAGVDDFVLATTNPKNYVIKTQTLSFNLGSERMGSEYFVDLCWQNENEAGAGEFNFDWSYSYTDRGYEGESYVKVADVSTRTDVLCDDSKGENFGDYSIGTNMPFFNSSVSGSEVVSDAQFCTVRHYFKENSTDFRPWDLKEITVESNLEVKLASGVVANPGFDICHVVTINNDELTLSGHNGVGHPSPSKEVHECQLRFENTAQYREYILEHSIAGSNGGGPNQVDDPRSHRQRHQDDYRGLCKNPSFRNTCVNKLQIFEPNIHNNNYLK